MHGCCYLLVIIVVAGHPAATTRVRRPAVLPGIGGLLALRALRITPPPPAGSPEERPRTAA